MRRYGAFSPARSLAEGADAGASGVTASLQPPAAPTWSGEAGMRYRMVEHVSGKRMGLMSTILAAVLAAKASALLVVLWGTVAAKQEQYDYSMSGRRGLLREPRQLSPQGGQRSTQLPRRSVTAVS